MVLDGCEALFYGSDGCVALFYGSDGCDALFHGSDGCVALFYGSDCCEPETMVPHGKDSENCAFDGIRWL